VQAAEGEVELDLHLSQPLLDDERSVAGVEAIHLVLAAELREPGSLSPASTRTGARTCSTYVMGDERSYASGTCAGEPPNRARSKACRASISSSYAAT
jgi:hypothetical protein